MKVEVERGCGEEEGVNEVKNASDSWEAMARVLRAEAAFEARGREVADDTEQAQPQAKRNGVERGDGKESIPREMDEECSDDGADDDGSDKPLPCFPGADSRDHLVLTDCGAHNVGPHVGRLGDGDEEENKPDAASLDSRKAVGEVDPGGGADEHWNIDQAKKVGRQLLEGLLVQGKEEDDKAEGENQSATGSDGIDPKSWRGLGL